MMLHEASLPMYTQMETYVDHLVHKPYNLQALNGIEQEGISNLLNEFTSKMTSEASYT